MFVGEMERKGKNGTLMTQIFKIKNDLFLISVYVKVMVTFAP